VAVSGWPTHGRRIACVDSLPGNAAGGNDGSALQLPGFGAGKRGGGTTKKPSRKSPPGRGGAGPKSGSGDGPSGPRGAPEGGERGGGRRGDRAGATAWGPAGVVTLAARWAVSAKIRKLRGRAGGTNTAERAARVNFGAATMMERWVVARVRPVFRLRAGKAAKPREEAEEAGKRGGRQVGKGAFTNHSGGNKVGDRSRHHTFEKKGGAFAQGAVGSTHR